MMGMPPATAASKFKATPFFSASRASSVPCFASSALLAVTTCLPALSAGFHGGLGGAVVAADQLDEDVDGRVGREAVGLVEPGDPLDADVALLAARAGAHAGDDDFAANRLRQPRAVGLQKPQQADTHGAEPGNTQSQRLAHLPAV